MHGFRLVLGASFALSACGGSSTTTSTGSGGSGGATTSSTTATTGTTSSSSTTGTNAATTTGTGTSPNKGFILTAETLGETNANAAFGKSGDAPVCLPTRAEIPVGTCAVRTCPTTTPPHASAGNISLTSGGTMLGLMAAADGSYNSVQQPGTLWQPGATVDISALGAEVPAFQVAVVVPPTTAITNPSNSAVVISRASGVTFQWTGAPARVELTFSVPGAPVASVACVFDGSTGVGVVPPNALAMLPAGNGNASADAFATKNVVAGAWSVDGVVADEIYNNNSVMFQ